MKKYYWSIENDQVISIEELEKIRSEFYPFQTMKDFLSDCSYLNNGDIEPLEMEIRREQKQLESLKEDQKEISSYLFNSLGKVISEFSEDEKILDSIMEKIESISENIQFLANMATEEV